MIISTGERKNNHFKTNFRYYISPQEEQANNCIKNTRQFYDERMHAQSFLLTNNRMGFFPHSVVRKYDIDFCRKYMRAFFHRMRFVPTSVTLKTVSNWSINTTSRTDRSISTTENKSDMIGEVTNRHLQTPSAAEIISRLTVGRSNKAETMAFNILRVWNSAC